MYLETDDNKMGLHQKISIDKIYTIFALMQWNFV